VFFFQWNNYYETTQCFTTQQVDSINRLRLPERGSKMRKGYAFSKIEEVIVIMRQTLTRHVNANAEITI